MLGVWSSFKTVTSSLYFLSSLSAGIGPTLATILDPFFYDLSLFIPYVTTGFVGVAPNSGGATRKARGVVPGSTFRYVELES
jgi:hypothetical protein